MGRVSTIALAIVAIFAGLLYLSDKIDDDVDISGRSTYDLTPLVAPRMSEGVYRVFSVLTRTWPFSKILLWKIKSDSNMSSVEKVAAAYNLFPTFVPAVAPSKEQRNLADAEAATFNLDQFAQKSPGMKHAKRFHTIADFAEAYRAGSTDPVKVASRILADIKDSDSKGLPIRALIQIKEPEVIEAAHQSAARLKAGTPLSVLDGVPLIIKDESNVKGFVTHFGTRGDWINTMPATFDDVPVARLRELGVVIIGKANMHELGVLPIGFNPHWGDARNPYNASHITGGSSSGSAAGVAAGFAPIAIGADGGGSIRVPAAFCGINGLKPTFGRVPALKITVGVHGPMASTVKDLAILHAAMSGPDASDYVSLTQPAVHLAGFSDIQDLKGLRIGVYSRYFDDADKEIVASCRSALAALEKRGAKIVEIELPYLQVLDRAHKITIMTEFANIIKAHMKNHLTSLGADAQLPVALGRSFLATEYVAAQEVRTLGLQIWEKAFESVDVIATPSTAVPAPENIGRVPDAESVSRIMWYVTAANFLGYPAISTPVGYTKSGLPIGIQFMARHWDEHVLLRVANAVEDAHFKWEQPEVYYDALSHQRN